MPKRRNPVVRAGAILRKGGVHRQSTSGHRHQGKRQLDHEIDDWYTDDVDGADKLAESILSLDGQAECTHRSRQLKRGKGRSGSAPGGLLVCFGRLFSFELCASV